MLKRLLIVCIPALILLIALCVIFPGFMLVLGISTGISAGIIFGAAGLIYVGTVLFDWIVEGTWDWRR